MRGGGELHAGEQRDRDAVGADGRGGDVCLHLGGADEGLPSQVVLSSAVTLTISATWAGVAAAGMAAGGAGGALGALAGLGTAAERGIRIGRGAWCWLGVLCLGVLSAGSAGAGIG